MAGGEFVEGWHVAQLLGEGAYGEVRLLVHARSGACVALKAVRGEGGGRAGAEREAALHRALRHPHVVRCLGARAHADVHYLFVEYVGGGELFDRIEPDVGVGDRVARRLFAHLLLGLRYLHERGVAHRDIKPENLLLTRSDTLKISDFGMATLFRHGARERLLSRVCGTVPYAAPEVLDAERRPYRAQPADLWAAAVVLVAMLAGELPWERAHPSEARYAAWAGGGAGAGAGVWTRVRGGARALLRRALHPAPEQRATLSQLLHHRWLERGEELCEGGARAWRSQPCAAAEPPAPAPAPAPAELTPADMEALISHSQPTRADDLVEAWGAATGALRVRLTRVRVAGTRARALDAAAAALTAAGLRAAKRDNQLVVECDEVQMRACAVPEVGGGEGTLLEFRRWRGCGLRFKRRFADVRLALRPLHPPQPPQPPMDVDVPCP